MCVHVCVFSHVFATFDHVLQCFRHGDARTAGEAAILRSQKTLDLRLRNKERTFMKVKYFCEERLEVTLSHRHI